MVMAKDRKADDCKGYAKQKRSSNYLILKTLSLITG